MLVYRRLQLYIIVIVVIVLGLLPHILFLSPPTLPGHGVVRARLAPGPRYAKRIHRARTASARARAARAPSSAAPHLKAKTPGPALSHCRSSRSPSAAAPAAPKVCSPEY